MGCPTLPARRPSVVVAATAALMMIVAACSPAEGQAAPASSGGPVSSANSIVVAVTSTSSTLADEQATDASVAAAFGERADSDGPAVDITPEAEPVTIAFGGDIHFERMIGAALAEDPSTVLLPVADMMADADIAIANLETAVTDRGTPSAKQFNFRTDPAAFEALRAAGIDVVSMANNHGMDFGLVGLEDSLATLRPPISPSSASVSTPTPPMPPGPMR